MRAFVEILCTILLISFLACSSGNDSEKQPPNFIIFIADDAAWDDNGAYGNPYTQTPTIKKLAEEGMIFTNAFLTTSSCSPSRCSILTGLYPHQTGAQELHMPLPADKLIFPGLLQKQGYYTVAAGKWHLGPKRAEFDSIFNPRDASGAADWVRAIKNRPAEKPFFMWFASLDPHRIYKEGIIPNPHKWDQVLVPEYLPDNDSTRKDLALYYDEIARLDLNMGAVIEELKAQGIYDNTVVIFMSDNGRPFPRDKTRLYDSGIKTPFIVRWPSEIKAGSICKSLISSIDIAPTICELAGVKVPDFFQGESLASLFSKPEEEVHEYVFAEHNWHDYKSFERSVRTHKYLYIQNSFPDLNTSPPADAVRSITYQEMIRLNKEGKLTEAQQDCFIKPRSGEELYDVEKDPFQLNNLIHDKAYLATAKNMDNVLSQWRIYTNDSTGNDHTPDGFDRFSGNRLDR